MPKFEVDFRLLEARSDAAMLGDALELVERQLQFLTEQKEVQAKADLKDLAGSGHEWESADVHLTLQERDYAVEHLFPRLLRGPFLITVWGVYESSVRDVADFVRDRDRVDLKLDEIAARNFIRKAKRYFSAVLSMELLSDSKSGGELKRLYMMRNALAHAGGRLHTVRPSVRKSVDAMIEQGLLAESLGYFTPSQDYLRKVTETVEAELTGLLERALHPKADAPDGAS